MTAPKKYREYSKHTDKPLLIYLHGAGERGTDPTIIDRVPFVKNFVPLHRDKFTILAPQQTANFWGWQGDPNSKHDGVEFIEWAIANYPHDGRVYVTGHSMGGHGSWDVATIMREKITAFVVSAGRSDNYNGVVSLGQLKTPARHYHGDKDTSENSYSKGKQVCNWYKTGSGIDILTTYTGAGHGIDGRVYAEPDLVDWMLSQGISQPPVEPVKIPVDEIYLQDGIVYAKFGTEIKMIG
jgi:predicted peptidase